MVRNTLYLLGNFLKRDYYNRTMMNMVIGGILGSLFFLIPSLMIKSLNKYMIATFVFISLVVILLFFIILRSLSFISTLKKGVLVKAEVEKVILFGRAEYSIHEALDVIDTLKKENTLDLAKLRLIAYKFYFQGNQYQRKYYTFNQPLTKHLSLVDKEVLITVNPKNPKSSLIMPLYE